MYTKGEWKQTSSGFEFGNGIRKFVSQQNGGHYIIAEVGGKTENEALSNAHLIAAAPDLYEALKVALTCVELWRAECKDSYHISPVITQISKAINKAEGK